jgi:hypothetical protein
MEGYYERLLEAVERPTRILRGYGGTLVAVLARKYNRRIVIWL